MKKSLKAHYEHHVLPHLIELACGAGPMMKTRSKLVPQAEGRVLEIGIGTGLNLSFYDTNRVSSITGVDPAAAMHKRARIQAERHSFDTIVCTFTLCTIPDVPGAFEEMRRVLKPGGRLLFAEHGRAPEPSVSLWQDRLGPLWTPMAGGCHLNRDIPELIRAGGFSIEDMEAGYQKGWRPMSYVYRGSAR